MARCISPIRIRNPSKLKFMQRTMPFIDVPCGKCLYCLQRRSNGFAFRISCEVFNAKVFNPLFITLTYNEDYIPIAIAKGGSDLIYSDLQESDFYFSRGICTLEDNQGSGLHGNYGRSVLRRRDLTLFLKRLRSKHDLRLRYFACGEYGDPAGEVVKRPHFHLLLWSHDDCKKFSVNNLWTSIVDSWPFGFVRIESVNSARIHYVAKYCCGKYFTDNPFDNNRLFRPFIACSQQLGTCYLTNEMKKYIYDNISNISYLPVNGESFALPRYIKDKLDLNYLQRDNYNNHCLELGLKQDLKEFNSSKSYKSVGHMRESRYGDFERLTYLKLKKRLI